VAALWLAANVAQADAAEGNKDGTLYFGAGGGVLISAASGDEFDRSNPVVGGVVGYEMPIAGALRIGFEIDAAFEIAGDDVRGAYAGFVGRARLGYMLLSNTRLWLAAGAGSAGYQIGAMAGNAAVGGTFLIVPAFGLDVSADVTAIAPASDDTFENIGISYEYGGGLAYGLMLRGMVEL
jgi:hypothetical protein